MAARSAAMMALRSLTTFYAQLLAALAFVAAPFAFAPASADPADVDAAARGVVRVVIIERDGDRLVPVSHGTGFAVGPESVVTNAHVVAQATQNPGLSIGIVPSDGENAVYARVVSVSQRNDLALLVTTAPMQLSPLTISGNPANDAGAVTAVGYPMNVDRAQGLSIDDIFRAQPPVKSTGFLSGRRPSRDFDSLLHTAPIARGNSGGPLLDECGRVVGVNSFGAESGSAESEFFFAVSTRELLPFLRANEIAPQINGLPCRSLAELDAAERARMDRQQLAAQAAAQENAEALARRQEAERREIELAILDERENGMAIAGVLLVIALGAGGFAVMRYEREEKRSAAIAGTVAVVALLGAAAAWMLRPGFDQIEDRLAETMRREVEAGGPGPRGRAAAAGSLVCVLDPERSRVTGAPVEDLPFDWRSDGCVNGRTQYGSTGGNWARIFVPQEEAVVSVNRFNPELREYRVERYLLGREAIGRVREARAGMEAPQCGTGAEAAREFGAQQQAVLSLLPASPNERLVYRCSETR
jgi:V8-like Glu-specific endopeptidase